MPSPPEMKNPKVKKRWFIKVFDYKTPKKEKANKVNNLRKKKKSYLLFKQS